MKRLIMFSTLALLSCSESPRGLSDPSQMNNETPPDLTGIMVGNFVPMAPSITQVAPKTLSTAGGATITVTGGPFYASTQFFINGQITNVMSVTSTQATLVAPPRLGIGPAKITAVNGNGLSASNDNTTANSPSAFSFFASQLSFAQSVYSTLANQPRGIAYGDLNGDKNIDAVVTHQNSTSYTIYLGTQGGGMAPLTPTANFTTQGSANNANQTQQLVDINKDGFVDMLVPFSGSFHYYLGNGTGLLNAINTVSTGTSGGTVAVVLATDINNDTLPDVIACNNGASNIGLFLNTNQNNNLFSAGQQANPLSPNGQPTRCQLADIDGDKKTDLVALMSNNNGATLAVYFGTASATAPFFTSANPLNYGTNALNQNPQWFELGDLNNDGKIDAVVSDQTTNSLRVFLGNGTVAATFQAPSAPILVGTDPRGLALADFNGDGRLDIAVASLGTNYINILLGNGDGTFAARQDFISLTGPWGVYANDFNRDGRMDLGVVNQFNATGGTNTPGSMTIYLNTSL